MMLYAWDHELLQTIFTLFTSQSSGTGLSVSCEGFFSTMEMIQQSLSTFRSYMLLSALLCYLTHQSVPFFLSKCTELLTWLLQIFTLSLMDVFCFIRLKMTLFTYSFNCLLWVHSNSFQMQMAYLESTPDFLKFFYLCLIGEEIMKK